MAIWNGKDGPHKRRPRKDGWTKERRAIFLDHLAMTCHVNDSAAAAGMHPTSARRLRRREAEFALLWADAIEAGRLRLEEEVVAYSLAQLSSGDNPGPERQERDVRPFDPVQALATLKTLGALERRGGDNRMPAIAGEAAVNAALMGKLEALAKRLGTA